MSKSHPPHNAVSFMLQRKILTSEVASKVMTCTDILQLRNIKHVLNNDSVIYTLIIHMKNLSDIYFDPENPGSFGGINRLLAAARKTGRVSENEVENFLASVDAYTLFKDKRRRFKRNRYMLKGIDDLWQADLGDFQSLAKYNDGYRFLLFVIDSFSKYLWIEPIKSKDSNTVLRAIKAILRRAQPRIPENWLVDKGTEFQNQAIKKFMTVEGINFYHTNNPDTKAAIAERVIRTIKGRIYRYMSHNNTWNYVKVLQKICDAYNNSKHRTIGIAPVEVTEANEDQIKKRLFPDKIGKHVKFKFKIGDHVRLAKERQAFEKGYHPGWTTETFTISKRIARFPPVYKVVDTAGETIEGTFYEPEIQKIIKTRDAYYKVEKILDTRQRKGKTEHLIKWMGYPENMSTWEPRENIKLI